MRSSGSSRESEILWELSSCDSVHWQISSPTVSSRAAHREERGLLISSSMNKMESSLCVCAYIVCNIIIKGLFFLRAHTERKES